jgi:hypothetical protein
MAERKQTDMPFRTVTAEEGVMHSGHETLDQAVYAAQEANKRAQELGVKARYTAIPKP